MLLCAILWDQPGEPLPAACPGSSGSNSLPGVGRVTRGRVRQTAARCTDDSADGAEGHACPWGTWEEEAQEMPGSRGDAPWRGGCSVALGMLGRGRTLGGKGAAWCCGGCSLAERMIGSGVSPVSWPSPCCLALPCRTVPPRCPLTAWALPAGGAGTAAVVGGQWGQRVWAPWHTPEPVLLPAPSSCLAGGWAVASGWGQPGVGWQG